MAESYAKMDAAAADGMKTSEEAIADIPTAFAQLKDDNHESNWCIFTHDGKRAYPFVASGGDAESFVSSMSQDGPNFAGIRISVNGATKFFRECSYLLHMKLCKVISLVCMVYIDVLYVGDNVGMVKRSKAQMLKNAAFNAMDGANGEFEVPKGELSLETIYTLISEASGGAEVQM
jgi:hypothetical protein